jgi:2-polyprenyl-3-methyl-5-hydroxy-6-metoxy-1,4-benzoquinol methylase
VKDIKEFWSNVNKGHRHIVSEMGGEKITRILNRVIKHLVSPISDVGDVNSILDWGCGGGLISKKLVNLNYEVYSVDLVEDSLKSALEYCPQIKYSQLIDNDINLVTYEGPTPDMILCNEVIQHFPTEKYFDTVLDIWANVISPKYIAIQVKLGNTTKSQDDYKENYLRGLILNESDLISKFKVNQYSKIYVGTEHTKGGQLMGYYIFRKL